MQTKLFQFGIRHLIVLVAAIAICITSALVFNNSTKLSYSEALLIYKNEGDVLVRLKGELAELERLKSDLIASLKGISAQVATEKNKVLDGSQDLETFKKHADEAIRVLKAGAKDEPIKKLDALMKDKKLEIDQQQNRVDKAKSEVDKLASK